jgi:hypothetical protein
MTIKCNKCSNDNAETAKYCSDCGAPLSILSTGSDSTLTQALSLPELSSQLPCTTPRQVTASSKFGDLNGDGKVDWKDALIAAGRLKDEAIKAKDKAKKALTLGPTDVDIDTAINDAGKEKVEKSESQINQEKFQSVLKSTIDVKFAEILSTKNESEKYLSYIDATNLTAKVRGVFNNILPIIPPQVEAACLMSEAVLAPSTKEKMNKIKATVGVSGGAAGIGLVIGAIGMALGWGATLTATISAFFVGSHIGGPIAIAAAGLSLAAIAGYFASTSNHQTDTERFLRVLKNATAKAVEAIWAQYETELTRAVTPADSTNSDGAK